MLRYRLHVLRRPNIKLESGSKPEGVSRNEQAKGSLGKAYKYWNAQDENASLPNGVPGIHANTVSRPDIKVVSRRVFR